MMELVYCFATLAAIHVVLAWIAATKHGLARRERGVEHSPSLTALPSVSIIVPAWQERGTIEHCITSLHSVDYPTWEANIVAGGPDGTYRAAVEACQGLEHFRVIEQQPRGKNAALNAGLRESAGQVIVLLDADSQVSPGWLRALVAPMNETIRATTGNFISLRQTSIALAGRMEQIATCSMDNVVTLQGSGSIAIQRQVLLQMGGFPEDIWVGVDWDLNARLAASGIARAFCPDAIVYTERPTTLREYWQNEVRWRRAHLASLFRLHEYFLHDVLSVINNLYIYALSWFSVLFTCAIFTIALLESPDYRSQLFLVWLVFMLWIALRRMALAMQVAIYMREIKWLRQIWVLPVLLFVTLVASCIASISMSRLSIHFKGPRTTAGEFQ